MPRAGSRDRTVLVDPEVLWGEPARSRLGRPPAHSRTEVAAAAVAIADSEGLPAVTMRRVATRIGASAMSLYTYVASKQALVELMIDRVSGEHELPAVARGDWRAGLRELAHTQRAIMRRHPWLPAALPTRQTLGPNVLALMEYALAVLEPTGMDGRARLEAFALLTGFVASFVTHEFAQELTTERTGRTTRELFEAQTRYIDSVVMNGDYPRLARVLMTAGGSVDIRTAFDRLLDRVIDGLTGVWSAPQLVNRLW